MGEYFRVACWCDRSSLDKLRNRGCFIGSQQVVGSRFGGNPPLGRVKRECESGANIMLRIPKADVPFLSAIDLF